MEKSQAKQTSAWRILLFARNGAELLLLRSPSGIRLPELHIPEWQRIVPNLNAEAKRLWSLDTVCLFPFDVPHSEGTAGNSKYYVMEVRKPEELARVAPDFMLLSALTEASFAERRDYLAVQQGMGVEGACFPRDCQGPFSAFGAFDEISAWVAHQLHRFGLCWNGTFRQLQAGSSFALVEFQTNRGAVWFKAVGEPNRREFPATMTLAARFPKHMPEVLAVREDWNAWLAKEVKGEDLFSSPDSSSWCRAAASLVELQIASVEHASQLLASGTRDARCSRLLNIVVPFFSTIESLMEAQIKPTPRRLAAEEIKTIERRVTSALLELERAAVPDTLNHFDLNPGNAMIADGSCRFLDWAEAAIGNPFFSMEYLQQHFLRAFPGQEQARMEFRKSYLDLWRSLLPEATLERVLELIPLIAAYAFAATVLPWDDPHLDENPALAGFLRGLARRMHRECQRLTLRAA